MQQKTNRRKYFTVSNTATQIENASGTHCAASRQRAKEKYFRCLQKI